MNFRVWSGLVDKRPELLAISMSLTRAATCDPAHGSRSDVAASSTKGWSPDFLHLQIYSNSTVTRIGNCHSEPLIL